MQPLAGLLLADMSPPSAQSSSHGAPHASVAREIISQLITLNIHLNIKTGSFSGSATSFLQFSGRSQGHGLENSAWVVKFGRCPNCFAGISLLDRGGTRVIFQEVGRFRCLTRVILRMQANGWGFKIVCWGCACILKTINNYCLAKCTDKLIGPTPLKDSLGWNTISILEWLQIVVTR